MMLWLLPVYVLLWALRFLLVDLPLILLGIPVVAYGILTKNYEVRDSKFYTVLNNRPEKRQVLAWKPRWMWLWGNEEDGIDGDHYSLEGYKAQWPLWRRIFMWAAVRNSVSNLRYVPFLNVTIDPLKVRGVGNVGSVKSALIAYRFGRQRTPPPFWTFARQGLYAGFHILWPKPNKKYTAFLIGWKLEPGDAYHSTDWFVNTSRWPRCGFGLSFKRNRDG